MNKFILNFEILNDHKIVVIVVGILPKYYRSFPLPTRRIFSEEMLVLML